MPSKRETKLNPPFLLNEVDHLGRRIAPAVLSVAQEIGPRILSYAQNLIGDPAVAITYLEQAAASVSAAIEEKKLTGAPAVRNVAGYLFRTFIHMVDEARRREANIEHSLEEYDTLVSLTVEGKTETNILLNEVMATCDRFSQQVVALRLEGWSWEEIGKYFGISRHAAEARFSKALDHARKMLRIRR
jgi:DNA-directed RNA polymerase specialized sigma24 family protein